MPNNLSDPWRLFEADYQQNVAENQIRVDFFLSFHQECRALGIALIPLKGLELLIRAYPVLGVRPMVDMDFLIQPKDAAKVKQLLEARGLRRLPDDGLTFVSRDGRINLDIIWDIWYLPAALQSGLWTRTVQRPFQGISIDCLHPLDSLIYYLAFVIAHRGQVTPLFSQDLDYFLKAEGAAISWPDFIQETGRLGFQTAFFYGLRQARQAGVSIPESALHKLQPRSAVQKKMLQFYESFASETGRPRVSYLCTWLSYPRVSGKLKLLRSKLLPSAFEFELHHGKEKARWYFPFLLFHPFWLVLRGFATLLRDLRLWKRRSPALTGPHSPLY